MLFDFQLVSIVGREELEKQRAHERYMRLQEQGKTEQARKDLGMCLHFIFPVFALFSFPSFLCVCVCSELELCQRDDFDDKNFEPWNRYSLVANLTFDILVFHDIT